MDVADPVLGATTIVAVGGEGLSDRASAVARVTEIERRYGDALLGFVCRLGLDGATGEEVVQEGLLRLYDEILKGTVGDAKAWTFTVVYRLAMSEHRRKARWVAVQVDLKQQPSVGGDPVSISERRMVWGEVDRLPERQREVLYLRYRADLPFDVIGRVMGITASAARSHATQALGTLRSRLTTTEGP